MLLKLFSALDNVLNLKLQLHERIPPLFDLCDLLFYLFDEVLELLNVTGRHFYIVKNGR